MPNDHLVVVVDDDAGICRAIERLLRSEGYRIATFTSAQHYLAQHESMEPACLIIDIMLPDVDGLTMLLECRAGGIETPAVFVTGSRDVDAAVRAMKAGASDLLGKPLNDELLLAAIRTAIEHGGEQRTARWRLAALWRMLESLTAREAQVCALVTSGRLNKQIAALIGTTEKTVKVHRARVMAKLGARSLAELVRVVDQVLANDAPAVMLDDDHRLISRPSTVEVMRAALSDPVHGLTRLPSRRGRSAHLPAASVAHAATPM